MSDERTVDFRAKTGKENKCVLCEGTTVAGFTPSLTTRFPYVWACYEVGDIRFNLCPEHNNPPDYQSMEKLVRKMWINK